MNAKDLLGKKIIDKDAKDLAKLAEIDINVKTFSIAKIYGSIGNPISKKYYDIPASAILAIGDYIQVSKSADELKECLLDKIPESEDKILKINNLMGKTVLDCQGNIAGKVTNIDIDFKNNSIEGFHITSSSSTFGQNKNQIVLSQEDICGIGDYILINKVIEKETEESEESKDSEESDKSKESVKIDIE